MSVDEMLDAGLTFLPRTLPEALDALEDDEVVAGAVGPMSSCRTFFRSSEVSWPLRARVHPWERETYLEVI